METNLTMQETVDVQIPNIAKELERTAELAEDKKQIKANLFTLVIYADDSRKVSYLQGFIDTILDKFPCRIIFIQSRQQATSSYVHVNVSRVTSGQHSMRGDTRIACDQIILKASRDQLFRVPFIVLPHLIPDLPVYLLWSQNPFEERQIFPHLRPYASRVIFDSECFDSLKLFCKEMQVNLDNLQMDVMDINWALCSNWRDMLVQLFDTQEKINHLHQCKSLTISYNESLSDVFQHPEILSVYFQGWLAARLNWTYHAVERFETNFIISYIASNNPVVVALAPCLDKTLPPGAILALDIQTVTGYSYHIIRKPDLSQVVVYESSLEKCDLPFTLPLPPVHRGLTFMKEIFYGSLGDHYREMLMTISKLDHKILRKGTACTPGSNS